MNCSKRCTQQSTKACCANCSGDFWHVPIKKHSLTCVRDTWHALPTGKRSLTRCGWDTWHALPIGKHSLTHFGWDTWYALPIGKRSLTHVMLVGNCRKQQLRDWFPHQHQADPLKIPVGCCDKRAQHCRYMKDWMEAQHPKSFVWLVCESACDLVHSLDYSLVPQIESNDSPELDFQQLS